MTPPELYLALDKTVLKTHTALDRATVAAPFHFQLERVAPRRLDDPLAAEVIDPPLGRLRIRRRKHLGRHHLRRRHRLRVELLSTLQQLGEDIRHLVDGDTCILGMYPRTVYSMGVQCDHPRMPTVAPGVTQQRS